MTQVVRLGPPLLVAAVAGLIAGCGTVARGAGSKPAPAPTASGAAHSAPPAPPAAAASSNGAAQAAARRRSRRIVVHSPVSQTATFRVIATVGGQPAAWIARRDSATLLRFDQTHAELILHAGTLDPGSGPYRHGPRIAGTELHRLLAAFNGGFRLNTASGGFLEDGHSAKRLVAGFGSVVIYKGGLTDVGAWHGGVPAAGRRVTSVRQNLRLLVSDGVPAASAATCRTCWGATLGGVTDVARSGLGITADGQLLWAAGARLSASGLATALVDGGAVRAVELDINPDWVAGYVYPHPAAGVSPQPVLPGQFGVPGRFLTPYSRDFFAVISR
jgi:hypothetical protein